MSLMYSYMRSFPNSHLQDGREQTRKSNEEVNAHPRDSLLSGRDFEFQEKNLIKLHGRNSLNNNYSKKNIYFQ